jgi:hypothetical protein
MSEETAIATVSDSGPMPLEQLKARIDYIHAVSADVLQEGEDFGRIPGVPKKSLFKPGAEKLGATFHLRPEFTILTAVEDNDFVAFTIRCDLYGINNGQPAGSGLGSCNSREKKNWSANPWQNHNNILKIAKKRAFVDAIITATNASDVFTQDVEDMNVEDTAKPEPAPKKPAKPKKEITPEELSEMREQIRGWAFEMSEGDKVLYGDIIEQATEFTPKSGKNAGQTVPGKRSIDDISDTQLPITHRVIKERYEAHRGNYE